MANSNWQDEQEVRIYLDGSDELQADPDVVRIKRNGTIRWYCDDGPWAVVMKDDASGPFKNHKTFRGNAGQGPDGKKGDDVRDDAHGGGTGQKSHFYTVAAEIGGKVYIRDPEVIVGPDSKG